MKEIGLYIHIPWCIKKCPYCDFNSHALTEELQEQQYVDALLVDLQQSLALLDSSVVISSIFIGGGTPSLFSAEAIQQILSGVSDQVGLKKNLEITLEANPGTFESQKFADFRAIGINRLSIGIQSFNDVHLKKLGRIHAADEAISAVKIAQQAGFDNFNLDLMFGLPGQTQQEMVNDIEIALSLQPSHISYYQLTLEPNTYFHHFPPQLPHDETIYAGQLQCQALLAKKGYMQYEISAYAKNNQVCQHNVNYWRFGDYLGIGAGAHGKLIDLQTATLIRTSKHKNPEQYMNDCSSIMTAILKDQLPVEFLMNQLRLKEGFTLEHYQLVTGQKASSLEPALSTSLEEGLLVNEEGLYCCSQKGWNFLDTVLEKFIC